MYCVVVARSHKKSSKGTAPARATAGPQQGKKRRREGEVEEESKDAAIDDENELRMGGSPAEYGR